MKRVEVFTDGSITKNPGGTAGWAAIVRFGSKEKIITGSEGNSTNNRAELMAVIVALESLKESCKVVITSDSKYVIQGARMCKHWSYRKWITFGGTPVKNADLWQRFLESAECHELMWIHTRGHVGHPENERCDELASKAAREGNCGKVSSSLEITETDAASVTKTGTD